MFERLIALFGQDRFTKLEKARVLVVGLGGVGGYALEALVRSGVKNITIVDGDVVEQTLVSNASEILSLELKVGTYDRVNDCDLDISERALSINKNADISIIYKFITEDNFNDLLVNKYDYVIDACDDVKVKLLLMKHANKYKLVSSMGTANKTDPSKLSITTLDKTSGDPLAKTLRKKVKENRIRTKFKVVSSTEVPTKNKDKVLGTVCYMPGVAGLLCASYVINDITK